MKRLKQLLAFNRGVVSKLGLARVDLERISMSAEQVINWIPRILGSMMLRPGMKFLANSKNNGFCRNLPFVFATDDTALIEMTVAEMRVRIDDVLITRPSVSTAVGNDDFNAGLAPWTDESGVGGTVTAISTNWVRLNGDGTVFGRIEQEVTVGVGDQGVEHALFVDIEHGSVLFKVGSTSGDDDYFGETRLGRGKHSLSFTPTGNFFIQIANETKYWAQVKECSIESAGDMVLDTPWTDVDLPYLRWDQSGDVVYLACKNGDVTGLNRVGEILKKIERRGDGRSWSIVTYEPNDGPFLVQNTTGVTMTPGALTGNTTLTASEPIFDTTRHVNNYTGALFRVSSSGQTVTQSISSGPAESFSTTIRVTGKETARVFQVIVVGTWTGTVTLQFAFTEDGPWNDTDQSWTSNVNTTYDDGQEDSIIYYRIGMKTGAYGSGTAVVTLIYANGSIEGVARVTSVTSSLIAQVAVLSPFGAVTASKDWWEGAWSYKQGFPTAVALHEGRLGWAGNDRIWMSKSDAYEDFSDDTEGPAGSIDKQIGFGPIRTIHWLLSMGRMMIGTAENSSNIAAAKLDNNNPIAARSSSEDEPLSNFNFNIKQSSPKGIFVDRSKQRLYEIFYGADVQDYSAIDLSVFTPDYNEIGITQIAVQMKPDVRVHCVRSDGTVGMLIYDRLEEVICWCEVDSSGADGEIEDVAVLPGTVEDQVYYIVKRTINSATQRHICKWALESEARGATVNNMADSFVTYSGASTTTPFTTELLHLRDEEVVVWADGAYVGDFTVSAAGALTLTTAAADVVAGLGYRGRFKSAKMGELSNITLLERKKINRFGIIAKWLHHFGLKYGPDFTNMRELPQVEDGKEVATGTVWEDYHEDDFAFGGDWDTDSRICLEANAPKPVTLLAGIAEMESVERVNPRRRR